MKPENLNLKSEISFPKTINWLQIVATYGVGFVLLLIGAIYMVVASKRGDPPVFGDYPEYLAIGGTIMGIGLVAFVSDAIKEIAIKIIDTRAVRTKYKMLKKINEQKKEA